MERPRPTTARELFAEKRSVRLGAIEIKAFGRRSKMNEYPSCRKPASSFKYANLSVFLRLPPKRPTPVRKIDDFRWNTTERLRKIGIPRRMPRFGPVARRFEGSSYHVETRTAKRPGKFSEPNHDSRFRESLQQHLWKKPGSQDRTPDGETVRLLVPRKRVKLEPCDSI